MSLRKALPTGVVLLALVLVGVVALMLANVSLRRWVEYTPPFGAHPAAGKAGPRLSDQVLLVVVDGLRYDASLQMPFLNELRHLGAEFIAETGEPSLSLPGWTTLLTGAEPEVSGVTTNWYKGAVKVDSVLAAAKRAGLKTAVVGDEGWRELFAGSVDVARYAYDPSKHSPSDDHVIHAPRDYWDDARNLGVDADLAREALAILSEEAPALLVLHFLGPDQFGHAYGAASPQYAAGVAHVDSLLRQVVAGVDLAATTVVVTSDHGHLRQGGHGGGEPDVVRTPLVLAGKGVARPRLPGRAPPQVRQSDVAPTIAVLLGTPIPAHGQGSPLFQALTVPAQARASRAVDAATQRRALALAYARQLGVEPPTRDTVGMAANALHDRHYAQAAGDADDALEELDRWFVAARNERITQDRLGRLPIGVVAIVLPIAGMVFMRPRRETLLALPFGVVYVAAFWTLYFQRGYLISLGTFNTEANVSRFFGGRTIDAVVLTLALAAIVGLAYHRAGVAASVRLCARACFWVATFLLWQATAFYVLYGVVYSVYLPDMQLAFKYYLDLLQLTGVGLAAVPAAGLAAALASLALRALPAKAPEGVVDATAIDGA